MKLNFKPAPAKSGIIDLWQSLPKAPSGSLLLECMSGSLEADILMLLPPPTTKVIKAAAEAETPVVPLSQAVGALEFCHALAESSFNVETDTLNLFASRWMTPNRVGNFSANKASTIPIKEFIHKAAMRPDIRGFVCVGTDAFKFVISDGKKPNEASLLKTIIKVRETNFKPVAYLPDFAPLHPLPEDSADDRDHFRRERYAGELYERFIRWSHYIKTNL